MHGRESPGVEEARDAVVRAHDADRAGFRGDRPAGIVHPAGPIVEGIDDESGRSECVGHHAAFDLKCFPERTAAFPPVYDKSPVAQCPDLLDYGIRINGVFNTHFDRIGTIAIEKQLSLLDRHQCQYLVNIIHTHGDDGRDRIGLLTRQRAHRRAGTFR